MEVLKIKDPNTGKWVGIPALKGEADLTGYATEAYVDGLVGDIETTLDSIIAIQENLIGGATE